ncbi:acetylgalactosaminyl-O-glycosyl-glycoprotein beta-1,3-N-acetylglucosaminyltransferase-like [Pleurodeles waltl]
MRRSWPRRLPVALAAVCTVILVYTLYKDSTVIAIPPIPPITTTQHVRRPPVLAVPTCRMKVRGVNATRFRNFPLTIQNFFRYKHCKRFNRTLDTPFKCGGAEASVNVFLLLVVKSAPENFERREIIRKTWGAETEYHGVQVRRLFILGVSTKDHEREKMNNLLKAESSDYSDILQWNFYDTFYNLTAKQVLFYEWMHGNCPGAQFVFNGDDDVFVHTSNVVQYLLGVKQTRGEDQHLFVGMLNIGMPLVRDTSSKYYVPEEIVANDSFPAYCSGGGILMSGFTSHAIFKASKKIPLIPIDDAYLGLCLQEAGLNPDSHIGVLPYGITLPNVDTFHPCFYKDQLIVHRFVPYEMMVMWKAIQQPNLKCGQSHVLQKVYPQE